MKSTTKWILTEEEVDDFLHNLKLEHLKCQYNRGNKDPVIDSDTLIEYDTFSRVYDRACSGFRSKCPKTIFAFVNNGSMQARHMDLTNHLQKFIHTCDDYHEMCFLGGQFSERVEFEELIRLIDQSYLEKYREGKRMSPIEAKQWTEFVNDHFRFVLNPFNRFEIFVPDIIESDLLLELRYLDSSVWMKFDTFKDFFKRFRDAASASEYSGSNRFLIHRDFHSLNVLYDDGDQPYTQEFVDRLFEYFSAKEKLSKNEEYKMDFRTFVNLRRMLHNPKAVATRHFLFELVDLKGDGFIDADEVRYFYNGLLRLHNGIDFNHDVPFVKFDEFYISWFDQIAPSDQCLDKKLSFDQLKNHVYGDECLMMLVNYQSAMAFESRFDLPDTNLIDDTIMDEVGEKPVDEEGAKENQKHAEYLVNIFE